MASSWWKLGGPVAPLHELNPVRVHFIRQALCEGTASTAEQQAFPLKGISTLDVGCGGGVLAESLGRLGSNVLGIDAVEANVSVATKHASCDPLLHKRLRYKHATTTAILALGKQYDAVMALEVVEHVADPALFLQECIDLVKPGGSLFVSTLNKSARSYALAIIGAEYVLRWAARGTHDWRRFVTPTSMKEYLQHGSMRVERANGIVFNPFSWSWALHPTDLSVNYIMHARKPLVSSIAK